MPGLPAGTPDLHGRGPALVAPHLLQHAVRAGGGGRPGGPARRARHHGRQAAAVDGAPTQRQPQDVHVLLARHQGPAGEYGTSRDAEAWLDEASKGLEETDGTCRRANGLFVTDTMMRSSLWPVYPMIPTNDRNRDYDACVYSVLLLYRGSFKKCWIRSFS